MKWDEKEPDKVKEARLLISPADVVYEELKAYGAYLKQPSWFPERPDLEQVLLNRNDPLINLGLAQYCSSVDIVYDLYNRACIPCDSESEATYNQGLRVACFANQSINRWMGWSWLAKKIDLNPLFKGRTEEAYAFVKNPSIHPDSLVSLYERTKPFIDLEEITWLSFINASSKNPRLNIDESDCENPDLGHSWIHSAILKILDIAPLSEQCIGLIYDLFNNLNPSQVRQSNDIDSILDRWSVESIKNYKDDEEAEGYFTSLSLKEEFRCLIASLFGRIYGGTNKGVSITNQNDDSFHLLGTRDAEEIALRCIYYGKANMTLPEMEAAYEQDSDVFVYAALNNTQLFHDKSKRCFIEQNLNDNLVYKYKRHCEQIHSQYKSFDPSPILDACEIMSDEFPQKTPELKVLEKLTIQYDELSSELKTVKSRLFWGVCLISLLVIYKLNLWQY